MQICEALHAAHRKGIVHRDLKPANILLTKQGVKLLDFGLAKLAMPASSVVLSGAGSADQSDHATVAALTGAHTVVGTPQYMAPEQIEGREVDARSDIFAFGCVLYEMLTGHRAFEGKSASTVMAAVLATMPRPLQEVLPLTPPALERDRGALPCQGSRGSLADGARHHGRTAVGGARRIARGPRARDCRSSAHA